jgi:L-malate glycosyltransferase
MWTSGRAGENLKFPRIAVVAPSLEILGGQGVQACALVDFLKRDGHDVKFIPVNPQFPRGLHWLRRIKFVRTIVNQLIYIPRLWRLNQADVVHVFSASYWSFLLAPVPAMLAARMFGKRLILHYHSGEASDHLSRWRFLVHAPLRLADQIVVPSMYLKDVFRNYGYTVQVIHNLIDIDRFHYRERKTLRPRILSMRNLESHYRVDLIVRAFALVKQRYPEATLTVCGYGSEEVRLRELVESMRLDGVSFAGRVDPQTVPDLYDAADIFVNASEVDNQPVSILEAFAAGLPVVSTDVGDVRTMLGNGSAGIIVPCGDEKSLARAVGSLLENPEYALTMTRHARNELARYSWASIGREWVEIYGCQAA